MNRPGRDQHRPGPAAPSEQGDDQVDQGQQRKRLAEPAGGVVGRGARDEHCAGGGAEQGRPAPGRGGEQGAARSGRDGGDGGRCHGSSVAPVPPGPKVRGVTIHPCVVPGRAVCRPGTARGSEPAVLARRRDRLGPAAGLELGHGRGQVVADGPR
ncbi:hypothetical protein E1269_17135 [Jiangella asiatica]|uniref:Uncharacterized protein n=1 Tax=Jiangella asiatica TaxID=2530372 RepID=A0A4R5D543_9ACTN|nr:hypothetical protein E1269_17135 [Jiangella asiatica]